MASSSSLRQLRRLSTSVSISKAKAKLRAEHDPDKALQIYSSVSDGGHASPTVSRYAQDLTVRRLAKSRRFSDIESFIESHKNDPKIKDESYLSTLIRSYGRAGMFEQALRTFDEMEALGTPRSVVSFNALLTACNNSKLFDRAPQLFDEIPNKYNVSPDRVSYGILVKAYCEKGLTDKAIETMEEMEKKGIEVTAVTFTTIMDALYKKGQSDEAEKLWAAMTEKACEVDVAAYNVRIGHCHGGKPETVKALIDEMGAAGLKPDTITYNYLMTCYCKAGSIDEARNVFEGLEKNGCGPNSATFRTLIFYLCKGGHFERAHKVFKKSVVVHKIPDFNTTRILVEGLVEKKKMREAKGMIRTIKKKFPANVLVSWKKVEERLGLASSALDDAAAAAPPSDDAKPVSDNRD